MKTNKQCGMTLIELMVALAIGAFLMIGAITVFMQSRATFRITESISRMQENARLAIDVLESDIRMAQNWGLTKETTNVSNRAAMTAADGPGPDDCGTNWTIDLDQAVAGSNNSYGFACAAWGTAEANADTLVVRRASQQAETPPLAGADTLRLHSARGTADSTIFEGTVLPAGYSAATSQINRLLTDGYYIDRTSSLGNVPSLRVKTLLATGVIQDQEVVTGVEDLQVQFGVDTDAPETLDRGSIDRYVNPDDPMIDPTDAAFDPDAVVLAVRIWLRVRAERPENGFTDTATYTYADQDVGPFNDAFRRVIVSKTIYLRNARPTS